MHNSWHVLFSTHHCGLSIKGSHIGNYALNKTNKQNTEWCDLLMFVSPWSCKTTLREFVWLIQHWIWSREAKHAYNIFYFVQSTHPFNSLWSNDAIWRHRSVSTLAQVMACCLTAPSHYLNQCWLIISKIQLHSSDGNFIRDTPAINH